MNVTRALPPPRPPHDPTHWRLDGLTGWRLSRHRPAWLTAGGAGPVEIAPDGDLVLPPVPGGAISLTDPDGTLGGLVLPARLALCLPHDLWLLDRDAGVLRRFDSACCRFETVPCTKGGVRDLVGAAAIATDGRSLYVADPVHGRVVVFALPDLAVRGFLAPPAGLLSGPWNPVSITVAGAAIVVGDAGSGAVHWFHRGGTWLRASAVLGAIVHVASDPTGRIYVVLAGDPEVTVLDPTGRVVGRVRRRDEISGCFPPVPLGLLGDGQIDLASWCPGVCGTVFDRAGRPICEATPAPADVLVREAVFATEALDSAIGACVWHRVEASLADAERTGLRLWTYTSDEPLPDELVAELPKHAWRPLPAANDALIRSAPGRYLWLAGTLVGDGARTPRLHALRVEYPRITLRRYLPAGFTPDPVSAEFTDRLLAIFDRGFRDLEHHIDHQAEWFDPRSAPADGSRAGTRDFLGWLGTWIGLAIDRRWPEERRRRFLRDARGIYRLRGTREGLRKQLLAYLGLLDAGGACPTGPTGRPCPPCAPSPWTSPPLVLEHFQLRRWLEVGHGRLGDTSRLWGDRIVGRTRLGSCGPLGATRLDSTPDPRRDPFLVSANRVTVFLPASLARTPAARRAVESIIVGETPAHAAWSVAYVEPRMRIGIQAMIGYDTVVGCYPEGITLDEARLGRGTVLGPGTGHPEVVRRIGATRVGATSTLT
jgi:phage tail-like protein